MNNKLVYEEYVGRIIQMQTEDGDISCSVLSVFRPKEDIEQRYIALIQIVEQMPSEELYVYRFNELEDGSPQLELIDSDDEYAIVSEFLSELIKEMQEEAEHHHHEHGECGCSCHGGCGSHGCE